MNPTDSLTIASSLMIVCLVINSARKMTARTANGVRFGLALLGTGALAMFSASAFPVVTITCGGVEMYQWMIPAGAAVFLLTDRRRLGE